MKITKKNNLKKKTQKQKKHFKNKTHHFKKNIKNMKYKKNITQKGYGKQERERAERQRIEREREYIRNQQEIKQRSRNTFINLFNRLKLATDSNDKIKTEDILFRFTDSFSSNRNGINTLIPVRANNLPINKLPSRGIINEEEESKEETSSIVSPSIVNFVPLLVIIYEHINDLSIKIQITRFYLQNMGNINLESTKGKISALSSAITTQDKQLVNFLIENGADKNILTEEQKNMLDILMTKPLKIKKKKEKRDNILKEELLEEPLEELVEEQLIEVNPIIQKFHTTKLIIPTELPSEYNPDIEPDFWKPIFQENEMTSLKQQINDMITLDRDIRLIKKNQDSLYKEVEHMWNVCEINKTIIPTYFVPTINEAYESFGSWLLDQDNDFSNYNIILCAALIIFGVISYKMKQQDYQFIIKGGKAIQLVLRDIPNMDAYKSEDIDLLIIPKDGITRDDLSIKILAANLAYLIKWFLNRNRNEVMMSEISIQTPDPSKPDTNQYIYKLSYIKSIKKQFFNNKENRLVVTDDYKPFADIDFKTLHEPIDKFFDDVIEYPFFIPQLNIPILFTCPSIDSILNEKLYFYSKYIGFLQILKLRQPITEYGYTKLNIIECNRILEKFKRAILAINKGILKQNEPLQVVHPISIEELKSSIRSRFNILQIIQPQLQEDIINGLYS